MTRALQEQERYLNMIQFDSIDRLENYWLQTLRNLYIAL